MRKHRKLTIAGVILTIAAAFTTALASPNTFILFGEDLRSALFGVDAPNISTPITQNSAAPSASTLSSFHFLEPLAPGSGDPAKFDPSLLNQLSVEVCEVSGTGCSVIRTFNAQGSGPERLRISGRQYLVNWDTRGTNANLTRRVRVVMADLELGAIDLEPNVYSGFGRTWPIRFLIEADPVIRVRLLRYLGRSASQIANVLRTEFNLCGNEAATLLAGDIDPFTQAEVDVAIRGVCQNAIIPVTTKVADEETRSALIAYDPTTGQMTFSSSTPLLRSLNIADVLAGEPSAAAPYGYMRKITAIRNTHGQMRLETVQAKLNEAISQGTLDASGILLPRGGTPSSARTAGRTTSKQLADPLGGLETIDEGDGFTFQKDIDVTINLAEGGGGVEGTGTVRVQGNVYFNAAYNVGIGIETCAQIPPVCVDRFEAWTGLEQKSRLRVTGNFDGTLHKEKIIHPIPMDPIVFFIGPVPVVIVPKIDIAVGVDGEAHVNFSFEAKASSRFKAGAKWTDPGDGGVGWENLTDFVPLEDEFINATFEGNMRAEAYAKVYASLLFYGVAGPGMDGSVGIGGDVQSGRSPYWRVYGHVTTNVNFEVDLGGILELSRWSTPILNEYFDIAESSNQPPEFSNVVTDIIPVSIQTPITLGPRTGFSGYFDVADLEGSPISFDVHSSLDGPINLTHTFTTGGLRNITVTARDVQGASSTITLRVDVRNSLPIVNIFAGTTAEATVQFFMSAEAFDPDTNAFLPCSRIDWGAPPDIVTELNGGCSAVVSFGQPGTRTVTVTATDFNGGVGTKSISVTVLPAPSNLPPVIDSASLEIHASSARGGGPCISSNGFCLVPPSDSAQFLWPRFGTQANDEYAVPLTMWVEATDPEGDPINYQWRCQDQAGTQIVIATHIGDDVYQCTPPYIPGVVIEVYAVVSDGTFRPNNKTTPRIFFYRVTPN